MIHTPEEVLAYARQRSPFYRELYSGLPEHPAWTDLPIVNQEDFWTANRFDDNLLLTDPLSDGVVFRSGGTTGSPKFSIYTREEWDAFVTLFGEGMAKRALSPGERVANLFYAGDLYASFLFIFGSLHRSPVPALQFPISGQVALEEMASLLSEYRITTVAGVPTSMLALADHLESRGGEMPVIRKMLFGGESMYADQRARLSRLFPGVEIHSIGYASVDAGLLGYTGHDCGPEEHRSFGTATRMEIVDDEGRSLEEPGLPGRLLVSNFTRRLMPILRYPCGDRAEWTEPAGHVDRRFRLLGRSEEAARVGPVSLYLADVEKALHPLWDELGVVAFQLVTYHRQQKDGLRLRVAARAPGKDAEIVARLMQERPMLQHWFDDGKIHAVEVEWVGADALVVNPRTGKLRRVLDERNSQ